MATAPSKLILGVRTAPKQARFALVKVDEPFTCTLQNKSSENLLRTPVAYEDDTPGHLNWIYEEIQRVIRQNGPVSFLALKLPEYTRATNASSRLRHYLDAAVQLAATHLKVSVTTKLYTQIGARKDNAKQLAEARVGRPDANWNDEIADAILAAWAAGR